MKKIILFLLLLTCGLGLAGCLGKSDKADISNIVETSGVVDHVLIEERYTDSSTDAEEPSVFPDAPHPATKLAAIAKTANNAVIFFLFIPLLL